MNYQFRLKNRLLLAALAAAYPMLGEAAPAARVEFASGNVVAVGGSGQRQLNRGSELNSGETINTGDGRAQLRFADGAMMSLQPQTEFRIDDYNYNGKNDGQEKGFFSLLRGGLRTISGYIGKGNRDAYRVTTSVATIGIRGTEWSGNLTPGASPEDTELSLGTGEGAIEVCNATGCIVVASGESAVVSGTGAPRRTDVRPNLPPSSTTNNPPRNQPYSSAEDRTSSGDLVIVEDNPPPPPPPPQGLSSGSGYSAVTVGYSMYDIGNGTFSRSPTQGRVYDGTATFDPDPSSNLIEVSDASESHKMTGSQGPSAVFDNTLAIGKWSIGDRSIQSGNGTSTEQLDEVYWAVGKTTPASELSGTALNAYTGTYAWLGSAASSTLGKASVGQDAKLTAYFSGVNTQVDLDMSVTAGARKYAVALDSMQLRPGTSLFHADGSLVNWTEGSSKGTAYAYVDGLFAGKNASHAGLTFSIQDYVQCECIAGWDLTHGVVAFGQDSLKPTPNMMTSGSGYEAAFVGWNDGAFLDGASDVAATFGSNNRLKEASGVNSYIYRPSYNGTVTDVDALYDGNDAVVGWGRWTAGEKEYMGVTPLSSVHYLVGKPMTAADITALSGYTGVYEAVGGTKATSNANSMTGTLQSARLQASFSGSGVNNTYLDLTVKFNGQTYAFTNQWGYGIGGGKFASSASIDYRGFVAKGGKQAGIVYSFDGGNNGDISGAAGLNRTSKFVSPPT